MKVISPYRESREGLIMGAVFEIPVYYRCNYRVGRARVTEMASGDGAHHNQAIRRNFMKHSRAIAVTALLAVLGLPFAMGQRKDEIRDFPPDFHQYIREALPEDMIPGGELALPSQILGSAGWRTAS
jgi:hypothetical protein